MVAGTVRLTATSIKGRRRGVERAVHINPKRVSDCNVRLGIPSVGGENSVVIEIQLVIDDYPLNVSLGRADIHWRSA